jgi:uncharacterized protein (DUF952 family)
VILHLTNSANWIEAQQQGLITAPSLATEGFIHCSTEHQMRDVANKYYRGATDMVLVHIDSAALTSPLKWEPPAHIDGSPSLPDEPLFPHIYGVINLNAVSQVIDFPSNPDGSFDLPSQLTAFSVTHIDQVPHLHQQAAELSEIVVSCRTSMCASLGGSKVTTADRTFRRQEALQSSRGTMQSFEAFRLWPDTTSAGTAHQYS